MSKRDLETFKEYAQRWRELAAQVEPPLSEKELASLFIDTLRAPYYDRMIGSTSSNFSDIMILGERIEAGMKSGKIVVAISDDEAKKFANNKKKEGETHSDSRSKKPMENLHPRIPYFSISDALSISCSCISHSVSTIISSSNAFHPTYDPNTNPSNHTNSANTIPYPKS